MKEKISTKGQARLKPKVDIFYFNNSQSYPKSASEHKRNEVSHKVFWVTFLQKRDSTVNVLLHINSGDFVHAVNISYGGYGLLQFAQGVDSKVYGADADMVYRLGCNAAHREV